MNLRHSQKAQTAVELAVFGSILIFVLGTIVSAGLNRGHHQNTLLKANRQALTMSYNSSASLQNSSRNFSSVLVIEDRLTAASSKYGAVDRSPNLSQGSGAHSANLFMPLDFGDNEDLPIMDIFVNGEHYALSTARFMTVRIIPPPSGGCPTGHRQVPVTPPTNPPTFVCNKHADWEPNCIATTSGGTTTYEGCMRLYTIVDNNPLVSRWCDGTPGSSCPVSCATQLTLGCNLAPSDRFDLDRNNPGTVTVPPNEWPNFAWQWYLIMGYATSANGLATISQLYMDPNNPGPTVTSGLALADGIDVESGKNLVADFDGDLKLETITTRDSNGTRVGGVILYKDPITGHTNGAIEYVEVRDNQEGDVDLTHNASDGGPSPGLTKDVNIYTQVHDTGPQGGTFLRIEDDGLYSGQARIRTTSMKDTADIVERQFQLSRDTGRICSGGGPTANLGRVGGRFVPNPVKVCSNGGCHSPGNIDKSCMDTGNLMLYMRSKISDIRGRKWITDKSSDPYVDITVPPVP